MALPLLAQTPPPSPMTPTQHAVTLVVFGVLVAVLVLAGRRDDRMTRRVLGAAGLAAWLFSSVYYVLPGNIEYDKSLPIQACDLLGLFAVVTLWLPSRLMRTVMYFGGFGLTTQAFLTPTSDIGGPDNIKFWIFWTLHGSIMATAIYTVMVSGYRPTLPDLRNAVLFWFVYGLAMIGLNYGTYARGLNEGQGWYYGYLGPTLPPIVQGSVLKHLGDWPVRPILMMGLALVIFIALWLPWAVAGRLSYVMRDRVILASNAATIVARLVPVTLVCILSLIMERNGWFIMLLFLPFILPLGINKVAVLDKRSGMLVLVLVLFVPVYVKRIQSEQIERVGFQPVKSGGLFASHLLYTARVEYRVGVLRKSCVINLGEWEPHVSRLRQTLEAMPMRCDDLVLKD